MEVVVPLLGDVVVEVVEVGVLLTPEYFTAPHYVGVAAEVLF